MLHTGDNEVHRGAKERIVGELGISHANAIDRIAIIFLSFALFALLNATVLVTLLVCALSVSGSIFLTLELNRPFVGAIKISSAPMRDALPDSAGNRIALGGQHPPTRPK